ncbi:hypothetical protein E4T56_gene20669 [Termitomyces sp. T112]|nr:hypothetical protein E4T56_gene20669 [Termitomyces sp. T112]
MMVKNCYTLLLISKLINNLQGAQYFTKLDIWWGYNNMCIQEGDEWKAAFQTNWGLFEPLIMFFRLTNSPTTFQTMMNNIFWDLIAEGIVYHSPCPGMPLLAPALPQAREVTIEMDPVKVAGVVEWLEPQNKKKVEANSSDFATGAVLSQQSLEDEKWHLVAFYSKSLNMVEWNYKIHDKEMLAIIQLFKKWQHFLEGMQHKFEVWMDHKDLEYFWTAKKLNR